jgi:hypothetical protein
MFPVKPFNDVIIVFNDRRLFTEVFLLFELFEESLFEVSPGGADEDEVLIFNESFILAVLFNWSPSQSPSSSSSSSVSFLLTNDLPFSFNVFSSSDFE